MSRDLSATIRSMWRTEFFGNCGRSCGGSVSHNPAVRYMEIPIEQRVIEVPLFAFGAFIDAIKQEDQDSPPSAIIVSLDTIESKSYYKSVERFMRDVLIESYSNSRLVLLEVKQGNDTLIYYGTCGAIFDKDFNPLMICSYQMEKIYTFETNAGEPDKLDVKYKFLYPILRVKPDVFLYKTSPIERFIVNKMMTECLEHTFNLPYPHDLPSEKLVFPGCSLERMLPVKIEICDSPFLIHDADSPSISTTNQQLLQLAVDHIDELIQ